MFVFGKDVQRKTVAQGIGRKVLAHDGKIMMCDFTLEKGAVLAEHHHPHEQVTYLISGKLDFQVGSERKILTAGDSAYMGPDVPHKVIVLEESRCVDVFTPMREDFITKE